MLGFRARPRLTFSHPPWTVTVQNLRGDWFYPSEAWLTKCFFFQSVGLDVFGNVSSHHIFEVFLKFEDAWDLLKFLVLLDFGLLLFEPSADLAGSEVVEVLIDQPGCVAEPLFGESSLLVEVRKSRVAPSKSNCQ